MKIEKKISGLFKTAHEIQQTYFMYNEKMLWLQE